MPLEPIHELDENGRPLMGAAYEEEFLEDEPAILQTTEPRVNTILRNIRNTLWIAGGWAVGIITVANPDESPAWKIAQTIGGAGILGVLIGTWVWVILEWKKTWDNRSIREHSSTYEWEQY